MKKALNATIVSAIVLLGAMASTPAFAHHGHHFRGGVGISIGIPAFYGPRYYAPYPYYGYAPYYGYGPAYYGSPPVVVAPSSPPEYIEQGEAVPPARQSQRYEGEAAPPARRQSQRHHWYYCAESKSYYPYVDRCAGPWQRVAPEPPPS